jgi:cytidyltransferase-like protein
VAAIIIDESEAPRLIAEWKHSNFVALHTGCYEVLHAGHIACFEAAKHARPDGQVRVIVGVESDSTLLRNREDKTRPLFSQQERCALISHISCVDAVIRFNPIIELEYTDIPLFRTRLKHLAPDAFVISYGNDESVQARAVTQMQSMQCAEAGILIWPVAHHIRTRATTAIDILNRSKA